MIMKEARAIRPGFRFLFSSGRGLLPPGLFFYCICLRIQSPTARVT